jgi:hypothetical protein
MTRIFAAALVAMILGAPSANAASMVQDMLKLQAARDAYSHMSRTERARTDARVRREIAIFRREHR